MTKNERLMRQRGKRLMKTLKKSVYAQAAKEAEKHTKEYVENDEKALQDAYNQMFTNEGETISPYMSAPPEWYDNQQLFLKIEARGTAKEEFLKKLKEEYERKNDGMD